MLGLLDTSFPCLPWTSLTDDPILHPTADRSLLIFNIFPFFFLIRDNFHYLPFKELVFGLIYLLYHFMFSISFVSAFIIINLFLSFIFFLFHKLNISPIYFQYFFSYILVYASMIIHFPLSMALVLFHEFRYKTLLPPFISRWFVVSVLTFFWCRDYFKSVSEFQSSFFNNYLFFYH